MVVREKFNQLKLFVCFKAIIRCFYFNCDVKIILTDGVLIFLLIVIFSTLEFFKVEIDLIGKAVRAERFISL